MTSPATLVAGIGNIFLGDDGFGVEVVRRLTERPARQDVRVVDFGIRGVDLAYALLEGYDRVILVDAVARGGAPGTLYVLEPELPELGDAAPTSTEAHGLVPTQALSMAQAMGARLPFLRVVGCEPGQLGADDDIQVGLSPPVAAAVPGAVGLIVELLEVPYA